MCMFRSFCLCQFFLLFCDSQWNFFKHSSHIESHVAWKYICDLHILFSFNLSLLQWTHLVRSSKKKREQFYWFEQQSLRTSNWILSVAGERYFDASFIQFFSLVFSFSKACKSKVTQKTNHYYNFDELLY